LTARTFRLQDTYQTKPAQQVFWKHDLFRERIGATVQLKITKVGRYHADTEVVDASNPEHIGKRMTIYRDKEPVRSMPRSWLPHVVPGTVLTIHTRRGNGRHPFPDVRCIDIQPAEVGAVVLTPRPPDD